MPIVFWASFEPWAKAMNAGRARPAAAGSARAIGLRCDRRKIQYSATIRTNAIGEAEERRGDQRDQDLVDDAVDVQRARARRATIVAPSRPPISAWLLELGRPSYQVIRFQAIAPMSAAATTAWVVVCSSTRPAPIVLATAVPANAPMKLNAVAMRIA